MNICSYCGFDKNTKDFSSYNRRMGNLSIVDKKCKECLRLRDRKENIELWVNKQPDRVMPTDIVYWDQYVQELYKVM